MSESVRDQVDQLLAEQGEYLPLELLLQEGRLSYADYEAWRNGELALLEEALFGDPESIRQRLAEAEDYLQRRGWQADRAHYEAWRAAPPQPASAKRTRRLQFSADAALDDCFHRRYRKPQDQPQLDLFTDNPVTGLVNGIVQSLSDRDATEARRLLERLYELAPDHSRLGELERLTEAAEDLEAPVGDIDAELARLQYSLTPLAESLLGPASRNLLIPLWRRLSRALKGAPYRADEPDRHLSHTAAQARDWGEVRLAVEGVPQWQHQPVLLLRHARACEQQRDQAAALASWFALAWRFPEHADAVESSGNHELREDWVGFQDLDPALPVTTFPAWLLLRRAGLAQLLPEPAEGAGPCPETYRTVYRLRRDHARPGGAAAAEEMALRARLKQQDPLLFAHFLRTLTP